MAIEAALEGLYVGVDMTVELTVYTTDAQTACTDVTGWTTLLEIRKKDTSGGAAKLSKSGLVSGTFNAIPASNTQKVSFPLTDDDLADTIFPGDDWSGRYSIKRTDSGLETVLAYGDVTITRVTQA